MKQLDLTPLTPAANLALDEALLDICESGNGPETLRFWEPQDYFVVVGYANKIDVEVNRAACHELNIPIFRRCSGGGTVLQGPGCLNYTLILQINSTPELQTITGTNRYVMERQKAALEKAIAQPVDIKGHTDLALGDLKFSGNAQRRRKNFLIFHGTFLIDFDLALIEKLLSFPSKEPDYRLGRPHQSFLTNLNISAARIKTALQEVWNATTPLETIPDYQTLMTERYQRDEWNLKF